MCLKLFSFSAASAVFVLYIDRNFIQLELHSLFSWFCSLPWILWIIASIFFANEDALFSVILFYFLFFVKRVFSEIPQIFPSVQKPAATDHGQIFGIITK